MEKIMKKSKKDFFSIAKSEANCNTIEVKCKNRVVKINPKYMEMAIKKAIEGIKSGGGPFAAVIVDFDGNIISCASNSVIQTPSATRHAEVNAIDEACNKLKTHILDKHIIYTSTEPCLMCRGAIYWAQIPVIVYGTNQRDARSLGFDEINISDKQFLKIGKRKIVIVKNFMRNEARQIFEEYIRIGGELY